MLVKSVGEHKSFEIQGNGAAAISQVHSSKNLLLDTWFMNGKVYKAEEGKIPEPLVGAFKQSMPEISHTPPYLYDRKKFTVHGLGDGSGPFSINVGLVGGDDIAEVTFDCSDFKVQLANAKGGKFPVTKEEFLKALYAAKLDLDSTEDLSCS